ncbi:hypothetical protein [Sphingobium sp. MK2]|uniref:hypothetical protein n=1 Tax=Sphingobium sp. MK2 TaxID=3116540 RepID=UPI0032E35809
MNTSKNRAILARWGRTRIFGGAADILLRATFTTPLHINAKYATGTYTDCSYQIPMQPNTDCIQSGLDAHFLEGAR